MTSDSSDEPCAEPEREPQPGDILLFCRARQWNKLITWFTKSPYYHVAIYKGDGWVVEARPRGVVERDLNGPDGDKSYNVAPAPHGREIGEAALDWALQQVGKGYDKADVAVLVVERVLKTIRIQRETRDKFSCCELVACAWENAGAQLFPHDEASKLVPADFARFLPPKKPRQREQEE